MVNSLIILKLFLKIINASYSYMFSLKKNHLNYMHINAININTNKDYKY